MKKQHILILLALCLTNSKIFAQRAEAYFGIGSGKFFAGESYSTTFNFGMRTSPHGKNGYGNAGVSVYYSVNDDGFFEVAGGGGYRLEAKEVLFKIGSDIGYMFSLSGTGRHFALMPQLSISAKFSRSLFIGLFVKGNIPVQMGRFPTRFYTSGLVVNF